MRDRFAAAGIDTASLDARILAEQAFGLSGVALAVAEKDRAPAAQLARLEELAAKRLTGIPVARLLGEKEFYGLAFGLNAATLVPRPETELLVDWALERAGDRPVRLLDLGTGTGCIPIAVLANAPNVRAVATDINPQALAQAAVNAERHDVVDRLTLVQSDWFEALPAEESFDLIVSNPPYIASSVIAGLDIEVRAHDPHLALDGGPDGLAPYRIILEQITRRLRSGGHVAVEIGADQAAAVTALFSAAGLAEGAVHTDLAGHSRMISGGRH